MSLIALAAPVCRVCDFCLIFVPFGHYDEPEILPYEISLTCPIGADVRQSLGKEGVNKVARLLNAISSDSLGELYRTSISLFDGEDVQKIAMPVLSNAGRGIPELIESGSTGTALQRLIDFQYQDWLPDDILMKTDKMTMAHSLEGRVPFMDEQVIRAAARLPDACKLGRHNNKLALRKYVEPLLPTEIVNAPKTAFYMPIESYLHSPGMRDLVGEMLSPQRTARRGLFQPERIRHLLDIDGRCCPRLPLGDPLCNQLRGASGPLDHHKNDT